MTIKLIYTSEEVVKIKDAQKAADRIKNELFHKRRNDAEDRAALKAEANDD